MYVTKYYGYSDDLIEIEGPFKENDREITQDGELCVLDAEFVELLVCKNETSDPLLSIYFTYSNTSTEHACGWIIGVGIPDEDKGWPEGFGVVFDSNTENDYSPALVLTTPYPVVTIANIVDED